jgi:hypothetical protein
MRQVVSHGGIHTVPYRTARLWFLDGLDLSASFSVRRLSTSPVLKESSRTGPINTNVEQGAGSDNTTFYASLISESYLGIYSKIRSEKGLFVKQAELNYVCMSLAAVSQRRKAPRLRSFSWIRYQPGPPARCYLRHFRSEEAEVKG